MKETQNQTLGAKRLKELMYGISAACGKVNVKNNYELKDLEYQKYMPELDKFVYVSNSRKRNNHLRD